MDDCPICPPHTCKASFVIWQRLREDPERWYRIHNLENEKAKSQAAIAQMELTPEVAASVRRVTGTELMQRLVDSGMQPSAARQEALRQLRANRGNQGCCGG
jgi:hypothetical protein